MGDIQKVFDQIPQIEIRLKYQFKDKDVLLTAFIHSSFINENKEEIKESNERLEFLGDAVFGLVIGEYLYSRFPSHPEGTLSHYRSRIIEASSCAQYLQKIDVEENLLMGKGEKKSFLTRPNPSILADLFEAIIGAIYLDGGLAAAKKFILETFSEEIEAIISSPMRNWKAELQDYSQKKYQKIPNYKVLDEAGPDHSKTFHVSVFIDDRLMGSGYGSSKKIAQQAAAAEALYRLNTLDLPEISS